MGFLKGIVNAIADPRLFFLLAVSALVVLVWGIDLLLAEQRLCRREEWLPMLC